MCLVFIFFGRNYHHKVSHSLSLSESVKRHEGVWSVGTIVSTHSWLWLLFLHWHNPRPLIPRAGENNGSAVITLFFQISYVEKVTQHSPKQTFHSSCFTCCLPQISGWGGSEAALSSHIFVLFVAYTFIVCGIEGLILIQVDGDGKNGSCISAK